MTLQVEVELGRMSYISVDDGASRAIPAPVCILCVLGEEPGNPKLRPPRDLKKYHKNKPNVMAFANDDHRDLGVDSELLAGVFGYKELNSKRPRERRSTYFVGAGALESHRSVILIQRQAYKKTYLSQVPA